MPEMLSLICIRKFLKAAKCLSKLMRLCPILLVTNRLTKGVKLEMQFSKIEKVIDGKTTTVDKALAIISILTREGIITAHSETKKKSSEVG